MFDFVGKRRWFFLASAIVIIAGIISLSLPDGLKLGTDFKEGSSYIYRFDSSVTKDDVSGIFSNVGFADAVIQESRPSGKNYVDFTVHARLMNAEEEESLKSQITVLPGYELISSGRVSPAIASQTIRNAIIAVVVATLGILLYMAWAFRKMPSPFRYGTCAIISLIHDLMVVLAVFSIFGRIFDLEVNVMFITACLAILGYSVNDTVVVFDRIRENKSRGVSLDFKTTVNLSLVGTITRSLNTTITTLLACLAVYLIVGGPISSFMLALLIGFASGAYSSFLASYMLISWEKKDWKRLPLLHKRSEAGA